MSDFSKEDVIAVAHAVAELDTIWEDGGRHGDLERCAFCREESRYVYDFTEKRHYHPAIKHTLDCPVLIAKDLLAGS